MERTPIIGITRCSRMDDYIASVERSGGHPRILDVSDSPRQIVEQIDGLVLTGGGDVDPALYREERHPSVEDAEPGRDEFEIDLARRAMDRHLPVLAICRGAQVLNVADGGTLVQDIPEYFRLKAEATASQAAAATGDPATPSLSHAITKPRDEIAHDIDVTPGSRLERALGTAVTSGHTCRVNSRHHQAVGQLGSSLLASATAPDGVVEAIEGAGNNFCIGVQWHPENFWRTGEFRGLFDSFVAAAKARPRAERTEER